MLFSLQVIARQQKVIRRQQRLLLSFSENPAELCIDSFDKRRSANKDPWTSKNGNNGGEGGEEDVVEREESTTGDSAMDEAWEEDVEEVEKVENKQAEEEENSDSFVTISDASFTDSELSRRSEWSNAPRFNKQKFDSCFKANPYFDSENSGEFNKSDNEQNVGILHAHEVGPEKVTHVLIGDPEELVEEVVKESCLPETTFPTMNCLPRPVRMFRRSMGRSGGLGGLSRSKSENNLRDLKEEKPPSSLFSSSFKNLWRKKEEEVKVMEISSPLLNRRPMVLKSQGQESLDKESLTFSSMTDLRVGRDAGSEQQRAFFQKPIFSCFMNTKERELKEEERSMPNHKTVTRPRDVKRRQRRPQQSLIQDSYQLNYSIC